MHTAHLHSFSITRAAWLGCTLTLVAASLAQAEIKRTSDIFRGQIIDVTQSAYTIQLTGTSEKLDAFLRAIPETSVLEVVRSGVSGLSKGEKVLTS